MNPRALLAILALFFAVPLILLIGDDEPRDVDADPGGSASSAPDSEEPTEAPDLVAPSDGDPGGGEEATVDTDRIAVDPADPNGTARAAAASVLVTVLEAEDDTPVSGAFVRILDFSILQAEELALAERGEMQSFESIQEVYERRGHLVRTDGEGRARMPWSGAEAVLMVTEGARFAGDRLQPDDEREITLRLPLPSEVTAQVVDGDKEPVSGVPVALHVRTDDFAFDVMHAESTSPDGLVTFRGFRDLLQVDADEPTFFVRLAYPGSGRPPRRFKVDSPPRKPLVLRMRDVAPIEVRVVDPAGVPVDAEATVQLREVDAYEAPTSHAPLVGGAARFPFVGTKVALEAIVEAPARGAEWTGRLQAVREPGVPAVLTVVAEELPVLTGRLIEAIGSPGVLGGIGAWHMGIYDQDQRERQRRQFQLAPDGSFRVEVAEVEPGERIEVVAVRYGLDAWNARGDGPASFLLRPGENDVGDIVVRAIAGRIRGRCVDTRGDPVANVRIGIELERGADRTVARTDEEGEFSLTGLFPDPAEVSVEDEVWVLPRPFFASPGDEDIVVRVARGGTIRATLREDSRFEPSELTFVVHDDAELESKSGAWRSYKTFDEDGSVTTGALPPGLYRARIYRAGQTLKEVSGIAVELDRETVDPRLQDLDLDLDLLTINVVVTDEDGNRLDRAYVRTMDGERLTGGRMTRDGETTFNIVRGPNVRLLISAAGFRHRFVSEITEHVHVRLERGIPVTLRSAVRPPLESEGRTATFMMQPLDLGVAPGSFHVPVPSSLATQGEATVVFPGPGRYALAVQVSSPPGEGGLVAVGVAEAKEDAPVLVVREEDANTSLPFDLPEDLFE